MNSGPRRRVAGASAVVVAAPVVDEPAQPGRVETFLGQPLGHRDRIERRGGDLVAHRHGERASCCKLGHARFESRHVVAVARGRPDLRLEAGLPASVKKQPLLWSVAEMPLLPTAVLEDAELVKQLAHQRRVRTGHRHVVRRPWVSADLVAPRTGIAARVGLHLEQDEVVKPAPGQSPCGRQPGDTAANNDQRHTRRRLLRAGELPVAEPMAQRVRVVDERPGETHAAFARQPGQRRGLEELTSSDRH